MPYFHKRELSGPFLNVVDGIFHVLSSSYVVVRGMPPTDFNKLISAVKVPSSPLDSILFSPGLVYEFLAWLISAEDLTNLNMFPSEKIYKLSMIRGLPSWLAQIKCMATCLPTPVSSVG